MVAGEDEQMAAEGKKKKKAEERTHSSDPLHSHQPMEEGGHSEAASRSSNRVVDSSSSAASKHSGSSRTSTAQKVLAPVEGADRKHTGQSEAIAASSVATSTDVAKPNRQEAEIPPANLANENKAPLPPSADNASASGPVEASSSKEADRTIVAISEGQQPAQQEDTARRHEKGATERSEQKAANPQIQELKEGKGPPPRRSNMDAIFQANKNTLYDQEQATKVAMRRNEARISAFYTAESQRSMEETKANAYWRKQSELLQHILNRLQTAKKTIRSLIKHFKISKEVVGSVARILKMTPTMGDGESTTLFNACAAQVHLRHRISQYASAQTFENVIKNAEDLLQRLTANIAEVQRMGTRILEGLKQQREKCLVAWESYASLQKDIAKGKQRPTATNEPALLLRLYERRTMDLQILYRRYQKHVPRLISRYYREDAQRISETQTIMLQHLLEQVNLHQLAINMAKSAIKSVQEIDPKSDIRENAHTKRIPVDPVMFPGLTLDDSPMSSASISGEGKEGDGGADTFASAEAMEAAYETGARSVALPGEAALPITDFRTVERLSLLETQKSGCMLLQKSVLGMDRWTPMWAMLSYHGFLHLFHRKDSTSPFVSLSLHEWNAELDTDTDPLALKFQIVNPGWGYAFSRTVYVVKLQAFEELADWTYALKNFVKSGEIFIPGDVESPARKDDDKQQRRSSGNKAWPVQPPSHTPSYSKTSSAQPTTTPSQEASEEDRRTEDRVTEIRDGEDATES